MKKLAWDWVILKKIKNPNFVEMFGKKYIFFKVISSKCKKGIA